MKLRLCIILLLSACSLCPAQANGSISDSTLVKEAIISAQLCSDLRDKSSEKVKSLCTKAIILTKEVGMDSLTIISLCKIADVIQGLEDPIACHKYLLEAKNIAEASNNPALKMPAYYYYSLIWERYTDIDLSVSYLSEALEISNQLNDQYYQTKIMSGMGFLFSDEGLYDNAKEYFSEGLALVKKRKDQNAIALMESYLAIPYRETQEYDKANELYQKSFKYYKGIKDTVSMQRVLFGLGQLNSMQGNHEKSNSIFYEDLTSLGVKVNKSKFIRVIATNHYHLGNYQQALDIYCEIEPLTNRINDINVRRKTIKGIANSYFKLGQFESAAHWFKISMDEEAIIY